MHTTPKNFSAFILSAPPPPPLDVVFSFLSGKKVLDIAMTTRNTICMDVTLSVQQNTETKTRHSGPMTDGCQIFLEQKRQRRGFQ